MFIKLGGGIGCVLATAAAATAQPGYGYPQGGGAGSPGLNPANVLQNIYNPRTQPLSPYLNLNRGGNPATNYYYGVRPGTVGGAGSINGAPILAQGASRGAFFPQLAAGADAAGTGDPLPTTGPVLPPAGHPVVYGNTLGYFPGSAPGQGRRPGLTGAGAMAPRPQGKK